MKKAKVYFTKNITPEGLVNVYKKLGVNMTGKVAVKLHSGEDGNQNYVKPEFVKDIIDYVKGTVVECNTAYEGARNTTSKHKELMEKHGWSKYFDVDIMDASGPDKVLEIPNGKRIKKNYVGKNINNYDSMLVLSHFKGHPMGGYGGALKQLSIGVASSHGKSYIHCVGKEDGTFEDMFHVDQLQFLESMADAANSVVKYFGENIVYINIMCNMSVDCDCCAVAEDPCMADIGILASTDPIAIDQACIDLVYNSKDEGRDHLVERIESRHGVHVIEAAEELGFGTREYELIDID
ncbi:MAG TPA: ferredoxin [Firmicutes bacterium]|nr:ferredoxin [Bacillota bacterium]